MSGACPAALVLLDELEQTQWRPPERLREEQAQRLEALLRHARETVSWYRALGIDRFERLPVLSRRDLQGNFEAMRSEHVPPAHGAVHEARTSGSTGMPVRVLKTALDALVWNALTLRDHRWHGRELSGKLAVIRRGVTPGRAVSWGAATAGVVATGPCASREADASASALLEWLAAEDPDYVLTYPSLAAEMARLAIAGSVRLPRLREVRTLGESVGPETRELCRAAWGVPLVDAYSCEEAGYLALQCPGREHYHVQSEAACVEVLDERGAPCPPGAIGRVVVTPLHNFAMPLLRYEIGDYAEVGEPCPCGRGLPVLRRILGRVRNMLVTAGGERFWPTFGQRAVFDVAPVLQQQFVQTAYDTVEARLVTAAPLGEAQERAIRERLLARLPAGFRVVLAYRRELPRSAGGKFEDFVCEVA